MLSKLFSALILSLSVSACALLPGANRPAVICPSKPVFTETEIAAWSDAHSAWVLTVVEDGANLGCWERDGYFGPDGPANDPAS